MMLVCMLISCPAAAFACTLRKHNMLLPLRLFSIFRPHECASVGPQLLLHHRHCPTHTHHRRRLRPPPPPPPADKEEATAPVLVVETGGAIVAALAAAVAAAVIAAVASEQT